MPAIRKLTASEVLAIKYDDIKYASHTMSRKEHAKCSEQNTARYTAQMDGTHEKKTR